MTLQFFLVIPEELTDHLLVHIVTGADHILDGGCKGRHHSFQIIGVGKTEITDNILKAGSFHLLPGRPITVKSVNLADDEEGFRVYAHAVTDLLYRGLTKAVTHPKAGKYPKNRKIDVQQVCHLHGRTDGRYGHLRFHLTKLEKIWIVCADFSGNVAGGEGGVSQVVGQSVAGGRAKCRRSSSDSSQVAGQSVAGLRFWRHLRRKSATGAKKRRRSGVFCRPATE